MPKGVYERTHTAHNAKHLIVFDTEYSSIREVADAYNINYSSLRDRIRNHPELPLEDIITSMTKPDNSGYIVEGRYFKTKDELCAFYNISKSLYTKRLADGMSQLEALTAPKKHSTRSISGTVNGIEYSSLNDLSKKVDIPMDTIRRKLKSGLTIEKAIEKDENFAIGPNGDKYASIIDLCNHYNISVSTYLNRMSKGYSQIDALTMPTSKSYTDLQGRSFNSIKELCDANNVCYQTYKKKKRDGYTLETILIECTRKNKHIDPWNNEFDTYMDMCEYHGISYQLFDSRAKYRNIFDRLTNLNKNNLACEVIIKDIVITHIFKHYYSIVYNGKEYIWSKQQLIDYVVANISKVSEINYVRFARDTKSA